MREKKVRNGEVAEEEAIKETREDKKLTSVVATEVDAVPREAQTPRLFPPPFFLCCVEDYKI